MGIKTDRQLTAQTNLLHLATGQEVGLWYKIKVPDNDIAVGESTSSRSMNCRPADIKSSPDLPERIGLKPPPLKARN